MDMYLLSQKHDLESLLRQLPEADTVVPDKKKAMTQKSDNIRDRPLDIERLFRITNFLFSDK